MQTHAPTRVHILDEDVEGKLAGYSGFWNRPRYWPKQSNRISGRDTVKNRHSLSYYNFYRRMIKIQKNPKKKHMQDIFYKNKKNCEILSETGMVLHTTTSRMSKTQTNKTKNTYKCFLKKTESVGEVLSETGTLFPATTSMMSGTGNGVRNINLHTCVRKFMYVWNIHMYILRQRDRHTHVCIYIYMYTYICMCI